MLTDTVNKMKKKSILLNITFILNVLSENGIIFVWIDLFFKIKKYWFQKNMFLKISLLTHL